MSTKVVAFVDGENLVFSYQEMLAAGHVPRGEVIHEPDCFVWSPHAVDIGSLSMLRINYYTHVVGDDRRVEQVVDLIAKTPFSYYVQYLHLIPRVHKKPSQSKKTKVVDVDITMDIMRAALTTPIDAIMLLSGDGDYIPLIREVARSTSKQVYLRAFSSGLSHGLMSCAENFESLDNCFFE